MSTETAVIADTPRKKKEWLARGLKLAEEGGYDPQATGLSKLVGEIYITCSFDHAQARGNDEECVDYNFYYPASDDVFREKILSECAVRQITRLPPAFDLLEELQKIDPAYQGDGCRKDVFNILAAAIQNEEESVQRAVEDFRLAASQQKKQEYISLASMVTGIRSMIFR